ncbi:ATP-dependent Clp protease proteolytic subunit [Luteolibacter yonseiensis]|uniref:ATP-dependent Clp protease proteolytic subunit n=1 Tax=Luteolibacter yonseiensis TaxID=1144680 RepID=A0A934VCV7_9BACT|nr:ATP-dependent Clp protease proteolytic subunit [Luteolibacter yonseiensis]MBK1816894.1 ATP-dependent Clp protease proteolytic subunit [Luteolibacter yonseiensis]
MKNQSTRSALLGLALTTWLPAQTPALAIAPAPAPPPPASATPPAPTPPPAEEKDPALEAKKKEQEALAIDNKLEAERLTNATNALRAEVTKLKAERELMAEKQAMEAAKRQVSLQTELAKVQAEKEKIASEGELSKARAEKLTNDLKSLQTESALEITRLQNDIARIETSDKRSKFADSKPVFLKTPLKENGIVVVSDRRIPLNGLITNNTADFITSRIQYWNNKDRELPIFIVIDSSPGGSVMAGYRILKAMESSDAPVHVVVKSFAASMAACITTLAKESYCYPNAVILHHQISSTVFGQLNLTQQREFHEESQRWWVRLGTPVANKMGITTDEFIKRMYSHSSNGDWSEFGEQAKDLKWVNHIVTGIDETSFTKDPDTVDAPAGARAAVAKEEVDASGRPFQWLPRIEPLDVYFIHNSDGYYRTH